jgi:hypothetical protein
MVRTTRLILFAALTLMIAGAAWAGPAGSACDAQKNASAENASTDGVPVELTSSGSGCSAAAKAACSAEAKAACSAKMAKAAKDGCEYCGLITELKANRGTVIMTSQETENGITLVFAATNDKSVETAQMVANKTYTLISKPAHCSYTASKMADASCGDCKKGIDAFAGADISLENTEDGAFAQVTTKDKDQLAKVQEFVKHLSAEAKG